MAVARDVMSEAWSSDTSLKFVYQRLWKVNVWFDNLASTLVAQANQSVELFPGNRFHESYSALDFRTRVRRIVVKICHPGNGYIFCSNESACTSCLFCFHRSGLHGKQSFVKTLNHRYHTLSSRHLLNVGSSPYTGFSLLKRLNSISMLFLDT